MQILKIKFTKPVNGIPVSNQKELNSYIHKCVGVNNKFHDAYSNYCISSLQGGKLNKETGLLYFESEPYILLTMQNPDFVDAFVSGAIKNKFTLFDMHYNNIDYIHYDINEFYDIVYTLSPILLKKHNKGKGKTEKISVRDEGFIEMLKEQCIKKLRNNGIDDPTFDIELHNKEKSKVKKIMVGNIFNICSMCSLLVRGKKKTREMLYNLGIGNSTGSGFGMVKVYHFE